MSARFTIAVAAVGLCLLGSSASATRHNRKQNSNAPRISATEARKIAVETFKYAVRESLKRAPTKRAIGQRRGLLNAIKNHGIRTRMWNKDKKPERGVYSINVYATVKTKKGKKRKDVEVPFISADVNATTGAVTVHTTGSGQIFRGKRRIRSLLPNLREFLSQASLHID